jgi:hypothetical protein
MKKPMHHPREALRRVAGILRVSSITLVILSVIQELRKPRAEREWHGRLFGFVPYDYRPPTLERFRLSFWNPDDPRILTDHVFGLGWSVNFYQAVRLVGVVGHSSPAEPLEAATTV